jgi:transcriptional regulator with XRE-family HTH domain
MSEIRTSPRGAVAARLEVIRSRAGVRSREVADLIGTTPQTVSRWRTGRVEPQPDHLNRLLKLEWLVDQLSSLYRPDEARLWLYSPHRLLSGDRPVDLIQRNRVDDVLKLIAQLHDGAYV